jgi:hypothetical protein
MEGAALQGTYPLTVVTQPDVCHQHPAGSLSGGQGCRYGYHALSTCCSQLCTLWYCTHTPSQDTVPLQAESCVSPLSACTDAGD